MSSLQVLQTPVIFYPLVFLVSLFVGSFLNVVVHRLPIMMKRSWREQCYEILNQTPPDDDELLKLKRFNLLLPPSHCPHCNTPISPLSNVPVISYILLRGRSHCCNKSISPRYVVLEVLCPLLSLIVAWRFGCSLQTLSLILLTYGLLAASFIDMQEQFIPDDITLPLLWLGLLLNMQYTFTSLNMAIIGAVAGYLSLWCITYGYKLITGKVGMGHGDFKLLALFGAWLGWQLLPLIILLSAALGAIIGMSILLCQRKDHRQPIPFGPYIAFAGWFAALFGNDIWQWYLRLFL